MNRIFYKINLSPLEKIGLAVIILIALVLLFRYDNEYVDGREFRFDRITRTVEIRDRHADGTVEWRPLKQYASIEQLRNHREYLNKRKQIEAIEEQTEAIEEQTQEIRNSQVQKQLNQQNDSFMKKMEEDKLHHDVEDIKDTLERQEFERKMR